MKFSAAILAVAGVAVAHNNVTYVTETVDVYTTYCPGPTQITHGDKTYTITEATTLTITDCPCTITKPVIPTTEVVCHTCTPVPHPTGGVVPPPAGGNNSTIPAPTSAPGGGAGGNPSGNPGSPAETPVPSAVPTGAAGKLALSGAGLAGIVGLAAFAL